MKLCVSCGNIYDDHATFCPECMDYDCLVDVDDIDNEMRKEFGIWEE